MLLLLLLHLATAWEGAMDQWQTNLQSSLHLLATETAHTARLEGIYQQQIAHFQGALSNETNSAGDRLGLQIQKYSTSVGSIVDWVQDSTRRAVFKPSLTSCDYIDSRKWRANLGSVFDPSLRRNVSFGRSVIDVPIEVYEDTAILNYINSTNPIDSVFLRNARNIPISSFQFVAAHNSVFRVFPGFRRQSGIISLYDSRHTPWFSATVTFPREVMIAIDNSGSTHGRTLLLTKLLAKAVLGSLNENDYVNVIKYGIAPGWVSCLTSLVPATEPNKDVLYSSVDALGALGVASLSSGLEFSFLELQRFHRANTSIPMVVVISDGDVDDVQFICRKYNWPNSPIKVFVLAVTQANEHLDSLRWLACNNGGFYYSISSIGAVSKVVDIINMKTSMLPTTDVSTSRQILSPTRLFQTSHPSLLITQAIFNYSSNLTTKIAVGAAGIEVPLRVLKDSLRDPTFVPGHYSFAVSPRGYVLWHPISGDSVSQLTLPYYEAQGSVIADMAYNSTRTLMTLKFTHGAPFYAFHASYDFTRERVVGEDIDVFGASPAGDGLWLNVSGISEVYQDLVNSSCDFVLRVNYSICGGHSGVMTIRDFLGNASTLNCHRLIRQRIMLDYHVLSEFNNQMWSQNNSNQTSLLFAIGSSSLVSAAGNQTTEATSMLTDLFVPDSRSLQLFLNDQILLKSVGSNDKIQISKLSKFRGQPIAVSGGFAHGSVINGLLTANCGPPTSVICVLLDDGAHVLGTNQPSLTPKVGLFLGDVDLFFMNALVRAGLYRQHTRVGTTETTYYELTDVRSHNESLHLPACSKRINVRRLNGFNVLFAAMDYNCNCGDNCSTWMTALKYGPSVVGESLRCSNALRLVRVVHDGRDYVGRPDYGCDSWEGRGLPVGVVLVASVLYALQD